MAENIIVNLKRTGLVKLPSVPNYILSNSGYSYPVNTFTVAEIKKIAAAWTKQLVVKSKIK